MRTLSETRLSTLEAYRQQWPDEANLWAMANPILGYHNPYYDNHDPDAEVDKEWFQGRDG